MQSSLIAVVLCIFAQASFACVTKADHHPIAAPAQADPHQLAAPLKTRVAHLSSNAQYSAQATKAGVPSAGLITVATAGTRDARSAPRAAPLASAAGDEEAPRRAGPAMLLAALALMSGIALRRYGAGMR